MVLICIHVLLLLLLLLPLQQPYDFDQWAQ